MRFIQHNDPQAFHGAVFDYLMEAELMNNVIIGLLSRMIHQQESYGNLFLGHVEAADGTIMAVTMRAGYGAILSRVQDAEAIPVMVDAYTSAFDRLDDVLGEPGDSDQFARLWSEACDVSHHTMLEYGYYKLEQVIPPTNVSGMIRYATEEDFEMLVDWLLQFNHDTGNDPNYTRVAAIKNIKFKLEQRILGGIRIWEDNGQPVSMAATTRELPNGGNISLVYTPARFRGRGYASAVTAAVSQQILDLGKAFCCLATDMSNPTSNKIYQAIGYRFVGNHRRIAFENPSREA